MFRLIFTMISMASLSGCCSFVVDFKTDLDVVADIDGKQTLIGRVYTGKKEKGTLSEYEPMVYEDNYIKIEAMLDNLTHNFTLYNKINTDVIFLFDQATIATKINGKNKPLRAKYLSKILRPEHLDYASVSDKYIQLNPLTIESNQSRHVTLHPDFDELYQINNIFGLDKSGDSIDEVNTNAKKSTVGKEFILYLPVLVNGQKINYRFHFEATETSTRTSCY